MRLIYQQAPAFPLTQLLLVVPRSGACLDPGPRQGLGRLTLRMLFRGAGGLSHEAFSERMERLGARAGFSLLSDHVTLRLSTLSANLDDALALFRTALHAPNFEPDEFSRVQEELTSSWIADREESKQTRAQEVLLHGLFDDGPRGYLPDGLVEGLRSATLPEVRAHYPALLASQPQREPLLAVLSDLPRAAVESRVLSQLALPVAAVEPRGEPGVFPWEQAPADNGRRGHRVTIVEEPDTNTDEVLLSSFTAAQTDPDWHLHRLGAYIFGGDMNSRLFRIVRGERGLSYGASCWYEAATGRGPRNRLGPFTVYTFPSAEHRAEAVPLVLSLYESLVADGVSEEELALARTALINSHPFRRDTPQKLLGLELDEALYGVSVDDEATHRAKLEAATPAAVLGVLQATHRPRRADIVLLGDPQRLLPIAEALPDVEKMRTIRYPQ